MVACSESKPEREHVAVTGYPADLYLATHAGNPGDVSFYRTLCQGAQSVLELGCGDARVLSRLGHPGRRLVGLDLDTGLLEYARARLGQQRTSKKVELVEGDMRCFQLGEQFDRIIIPYGGLFCLPDYIALLECLGAIHAHLAPGGQLILDTYAADAFHRQGPIDDSDQRGFSKVATINVGRVRYDVAERSEWNREQQTLDVCYRYQSATRAPIEAWLPQRYVLASQLRDAASAERLEPMNLWGGFDRRPYDPAGSDLMVFRATKPAADPLPSARQ